MNEIFQSQNSFLDGGKRKSKEKEILFGRTQMKIGRLLLRFRRDVFNDSFDSLTDDQRTLIVLGFAAFNQRARKNATRFASHNPQPREKDENDEKKEKEKEKDEKKEDEPTFEMIIASMKREAVDNVGFGRFLLFLLKETFTDTKGENLWVLSAAKMMKENPEEYPAIGLQQVLSHEECDFVHWVVCKKNSARLVEGLWWVLLRDLKLSRILYDFWSWFRPTGDDEEVFDAFYHSKKCDDPESFVHPFNDETARFDRCAAKCECFMCKSLVESQVLFAEWQPNCKEEMLLKRYVTDFETFLHNLRSFGLNEQEKMKKEERVE